MLQAIRPEKHSLPHSQPPGTKWVACHMHTHWNRIVDRFRLMRRRCSQRRGSIWETQFLL